MPSGSLKEKWPCWGMGVGGKEVSVLTGPLKKILSTIFINVKHIKPGVRDRKLI